MSASEKLKALDEAFDTQMFLATLNYYIGPGARTATSREQVKTYYDVKAVLVALPQIVAVVEAAEAITHLWTVRDDGGEWYVSRTGAEALHRVGAQTDAALAALEQALTNPQGKD